jgi:predicted MFS family arabinose efflux permease
MAIMIWVIVIPLGAIVVRTRPAEMGMYPDGDPIPAGAPRERAVAVGGVSLRKAAGTPTFWLIAASFFAGCFASMGLVQAPVPFLQDIGFPIQTAASALSAVGIGSALGKIVFGWLCDRMQPRHAWAIGQAMMAVSVVILLGIDAESSIVPIWAYALLAGFGMGAWLPTLPYWPAATSVWLLRAVFEPSTWSRAPARPQGPSSRDSCNDASGTYSGPLSPTAVAVDRNPAHPAGEEACRHRVD